MFFQEDCADQLVKAQVFSLSFREHCFHSSLAVPQSQSSWAWMLSFDSYIHRDIDFIIGIKIINILNSSENLKFSLIYSLYYPDPDLFYCPQLGAFFLLLEINNENY